MPRQAILTRFLGPTPSNMNPRILARADAGRVTIDQPDLDRIEDRHQAAAIELCRKFGWKGVLHCGNLPEKGTPWAYCFVIEDGPGAQITHKLIVTGEWRPLNAIGSFEKFKVELEAANGDAAREMVREQYSLTHTIHCKLVKTKSGVIMWGRP